MGVSYFIQCKKCQEVVDYLYSVDKYELAENVDARFYFSWDTVNVEKLTQWIENHQEHGEIEFSAD